MSRSYDRQPPLPPGGGAANPRDPYDPPFEGPYEPYDDPTVQPTGRPTVAANFTRDGRTAPPQRPRMPEAGAVFDYQPLQVPFEPTKPPRPAPPEPFDLGPPQQAAPAGRQMHAPVRTKRSDKSPVNAPIVPAGSVTGRSLTLVIAIMCFLACLTAGAVYMIRQSAAAWERDIATEVTAQVEARGTAVEMEKTLREVAQFLGKQPGIRNARPLGVEENSALLEPWIGSSEALKSLPVPRLISIELDRSQRPDYEAMRAGLAKQFKGVTLDDHSQWQQQIRTVTRSFALGGIAILLLVAAATTAIIISATRAAMASNRDIVEVLHFVGATDHFIAREFERNFMQLGIRAGLVGALAAMVVFAALPTAMIFIGGGSVSLAQLQQLVGVGTLDWVGYALLACLVVVVAILCRFTSRFSVSRILHSRN